MHKSKKTVKPPAGRVPENLPFTPRQLAPLLITLVAFVLVIYLPPHKDFFALDDRQYVTYNPDIKELSVDNLKAIFSRQVNGNYHPVTMLSLMADYALYGSHAQGYHATNIIIHCSSVIICFFIFLQLTQNIKPAFLVALLFGIHPLHVESVAWISERKDMLYVLFYFSAMLSYLQYQKRYEQKFLWLTGSFFLLSLLSKGMAVTLPPVLLLLDYLKIY